MIYKVVRTQLASERLEDGIERCESIARMFLAEAGLQQTLTRDNALPPTGTGLMRTSSLQRLNQLFQYYRKALLDNP